jgi:hypothetical protein
LIRGNQVKRLVRIVAISLGSLVVFAVAAALVSTLALGYRFDRQNRQLAQSISQKLAPVVRTPQSVWDTDLRPYGFPEDSFDSPYVDFIAPATIAMSDSLAAVTFRKSHYEDKKLVQDGHLITVSLATGSVTASTKWPGPIGVGPYVFCCTTDMQFYGYADSYLFIRNGEVAGKRTDSPVGPNTQKAKVSLGTNGRPSSIEIVHDDGSKSSFEADCGNVGDSYLSKDALVVIGCNTLWVIGADGRLFFSDAFGGAGLHFGGASKYGKRFVIAVSASHGGDPPYLTDEWLVVYETQRRAPVFAVKSDPLPYMQSQSALSADGDYLLAGSGGHLRLLKILK